MWVKCPLVVSQTRAKNMGISQANGIPMKNHAQPESGPEPQWSADGQWWWDGERWTQMWRPPRGLSWDGQTWVRVAEAAVVAMPPPPSPPPPPPLLAPVAPQRAVADAARGGNPPSSRPPRPRRRVRRDPASRRQAGPPKNPPPPPMPRVAGHVFIPGKPRLAPSPPEAVPAAALSRQDLLPPPPAQAVYALTASNLRRIPNRTLWLVAAAMVLILAGISSVALAIALGRQPGGSSQAPGIGAPRLTAAQVARALVGRQFTRDVVPPELADAAPIHDVYVADSVPGLIGESSTTTSDLGGTVTFYVFADPVWAEAFFENPPTAFGCGVCTSMGDAAPVHGVGDKATSYVLYRKKVGGQSWIATTTYVLSGSVVINGLYFPVNVANPSPAPTDLSVATAYTKAAAQLLKKISA
jgi:hypothetical protein